MMHNEAYTEKAADRLEYAAMKKSDAAYASALETVLRKHKQTLERIRREEQNGNYASVRLLVRSSGLLDDLARALAGAGKESAAVIGGMLGQVRGVVQDESG